MLDFIKTIFPQASNDAPVNTITAADLGARTLGVELEEAKVAHEHFRARLQSYFAGRSTETFLAADVCLDDRCELGRWIYGRGRTQLGRHPGFTALMGHHQMFHYTASSLVVLARVEAENETRKRRLEQFERFSCAVLQDLENLRLALLPAAALKSA